MKLKGSQDKQKRVLNDRRAALENDVRSYSYIGPFHTYYILVFEHMLAVTFLCVLEPKVSDRVLSAPRHFVSALNQDIKTLIY